MLTRPNLVAVVTALLFASSAIAAERPKPPPIDPEKLQALLPATLGTDKLDKAECDKTDPLQISQGYAHGTYKGGDNGNATGDARIGDYGNKRPNVASTVAGTNSPPIDNDVETSKPITIAGNPAQEVIMKHSREICISVVVDKRFVVSIDLAPTDEAAAIDAANAFDFAALRALEK